MKIWVIGSNGMLGSSLLNLCSKKGIAAVGASHKEADITDVAQLIEKSREIRPSHIVNCAAYTDVDGAEKNREQIFAVNAQGPENIAIVAKSAGAQLVHISTDYVFDGQGERPYREEDECHPLNVYGQSKREGELRVLDVLPTACILRTSWIFGPKGKNFISSVVKWLQEKDELQVVADQYGKPTYCNDLAEAILKLLDVEGIVHFANENPRSRYQIACDVMEMMKMRGIPIKCEKITPVLTAQFPTSAVRPAYSVLDTTKYFHLTNQRPRPWGEAINELINAFKI